MKKNEKDLDNFWHRKLTLKVRNRPILIVLWKCLRGHFWSVAKVALRIWSGTWNWNLNSYLISGYLNVNVLTLSEYSSFSVRPKARAITRFFPKKNVECVFQLSRTCWKWVFRILSTANTNNLGYSSTDFLILSTKAWKLNKQWRVSNNACVLQFNHLLR